MALVVHRELLDSLALAMWEAGIESFKKTYRGVTVIMGRQVVPGADPGRALERVLAAVQGVEGRQERIEFLEILSGRAADFRDGKSGEVGAPVH